MKCGRRHLGAVLLCAMAALGGCTARLPGYAPMSAADSLGVIADRLEKVQTVSGTCDVTLTDASGDTVQLDGALAARFPGSLRVRAWKLGHAVFDLTIADGRTWLLVPERNGAQVALGTERIPAERLSRALSILGPGYYRGATVVAPERAEGPLVVSGPGPADGPLVCEIDRATLTPRRFVTGSGAGGSTGLLSLEDYRIVNGIAWPMVLRARGTEGEVILRMRDIEINAPLPAGALVPPRRAVERS